MHPFTQELIKILNRQYGHTGARFDAIVGDFVEQALLISGFQLTTVVPDAVSGVNSLDAAKDILAIAQTLWGIDYMMDTSGAVWPINGNGPHFDSFSEAIKAMQDHISTKHAADLLAAITGAETLDALSG